MGTSHQLEVGVRVGCDVCKPGWNAMSPSAFVFAVSGASVGVLLEGSVDDWSRHCGRLMDLIIVGRCFAGLKVDV